MEIPHSVLSEEFQKRTRGRRIKSAVFLTFCFEPGFFEQEILPSVLDVPLSHVPAVRLLQLEETLKSSVEHVAVYYDRSALISQAESAKLDVRRIPMSHGTGFFHPKNVLLLTESDGRDQDSPPTRHLLVATLSANLTRAGWWENVEVCHFEEVADGEACGFRDDLLDLIRRVKSSTRHDENHDALEFIRRFVLQLEQRPYASAGGVLHPRLYSGGLAVVDFLDESRGEQLKGLCLEVISPYFDASGAAPLAALCERFRPREVRVFLPRADDGSADLADNVYETVRAMSGVKWARLPQELLRAGKNEQVKRRAVHAKVYRFFDPRARYEAFLVGSINLTTPAHSRTGNFESAFLVETAPKRSPDWWLEADVRRPPAFLGAGTEEVASATTALTVRFDWSSMTASMFWDASTASGSVTVSAQGAVLFRVDSLVPREWQPLQRDDASAIERVLSFTSFLGVSEDGGPEAAILVQEEGMAHKPSLLFSLSAADILRYWSLLTPEQREAFLDDHIGAIPAALAELGLDSPPLQKTTGSVFDTFAGVYHAFFSLERFVLDALEAGRFKEAEYRLLGRKYDSLPNLLERVLKDGTTDLVTRYVIILCAKQLVARVEREASEFVTQQRVKLTELKHRIADAEGIRNEFRFGSDEERAAFLDWFDRWFLARAEPTETTA